MADGAAQIPRHDPDAESACLSAAIFDHAAALELVELLEEGDYHFDANRHVHRAIRDICVRGERVDEVSVLGQLRATKRLDQIGGAAYLAQLATVPHTVQLEQHAKVVRGWARIRRAHQTFRELTVEASGAAIPDVDTWLDSAERRAYAATGSVEAARAHGATYADTWAILKAGWDEADARNDRTWGTPTGFHRLDEHTLGFRPGQLWYVGARPGQGKTAFAQQIAEYVAERGGGSDAVIIDSQEMTRAELVARAAARASGHGHRQIVRRRLDDAGWAAVTEASVRLAALPIAIDDQKRITPLKLRAKVRRHLAELHKAHPKAKLRLVVVDYVQLMQPDRDRHNGTRAGELGEISGALKQMAGEFECTVLALSQLTRHTDKTKAPPAPTLFDFRDSGAIEADGDVVIGLHRPDQYRKPGENHDGICQVHVLKGRGCGENAFELRFDGPTTRFDNIVAEQDQLWRQEELL